MQKLILAIVAASLMGSLAAVAQTTPPEPGAVCSREANGTARFAVDRISVHYTHR
jgi:hypothetical protein